MDVLHRLVHCGSFADDFHSIAISNFSSGKTKSSWAGCSTAWRLEGERSKLRDFHVVIPKEVSVLDTNCLRHHSKIQSIAFESGSSINRIDKHSSWRRSLKSLHIAATICSIAVTTFAGYKVESLTVNPANPRTLKECLLIDVTDARYVRYFGEADEVRIGQDVFTVGNWCFSQCKMSTATSAGDSHLTRI